MSSGLNKNFEQSEHQIAQFLTISYINMLCFECFDIVNNFYDYFSFRYKAGDMNQKKARY